MLKKLLVLTLILVGAFSLTACDLTSGDLTDLEKLDEAIADLSIALEVSGDVTLPTAGLHEVVITWESANTAIFANDGTVTQPAFSDGNAVVAVKAILTLGDAVPYEKTFTVTVLATTVLTDLEKLAAAVPEITVVAETGISITLPVTGLHGVAIAWESSQPWYISETGAVTDRKSVV